MTAEQAIEMTRAKWSHAPIDVRDVEERVALRDVAGVVVAAPQPHCPAARLFVRHGERWRSRYVHRLDEVDAVLDWCRGAA